MAELSWYACVYESERRIIHGRAPRGDASLADRIKSSLTYHNLIGLQSKLYIRESRLSPKEVRQFCEHKSDRARGDYRDYKLVKVDFRSLDDPILPRSS
jgi:hypothetical protein